MFKNIHEILSEASDTIIARGRAYYQDGMVVSVTDTSSTTTEAQVLGSGDEPYTVEIISDGKGTITGCFCDCPYERDGLCKHIVAVLLMLEHEDVPVKTPAHPSAQQVLDTLNEQQLRAFLRSRLAVDKALARALCDHFVEPDAKQELASLRHALDRLGQQADQAWDSWQLAQQLYDKLNIHAEHAQLRLSQGYHLLSAQIALEVLKACFHMLETIEDGSDFYDIVDAMVDVLCKAAAAGQAADRPSLRTLIEAAIKLCTPWGFDDEIVQLLESSARLLPSDQRGIIHALLEKTAQDRHMPLDTAQQLEARLIEHLEGAEAAAAFRMAHLDNDAFQAAAIEEALEAGEYQRAIEYCQKRLANCEKTYDRCRWLKLLLRAYQATHHEEGELQVLTELTMLQPSTYYDQLRQLHIQRGTWQQDWPTLREQLKSALHPDEYMVILFQEKQWPLLLEMVTRHPEKITAYGEALMQYDPHQAIRLYEAMIRQRARCATQRSMYAYTCSGIHAMYKAGAHAEALRMIEALEAEYKRRPAFLDELKSLRDRLSVQGSHKPQ